MGENKSDAGIDDRAIDSLAVAPGASDEHKRDAGRDASIGQRLARDPESKDARLDNALDESMDASDPPSSTQPVHNNAPPESSGFDAAEEAERQRDA